jgi:DNA-binding MarR family transcriptional regulator
MDDRRDELIARLLRELVAGDAAAHAADDAFADSIGVNRTDARCLRLLERGGPLTAGDVARAVALTTGAVTAVLDRLEAVGYARRVRDPEDRRRVLVDVTPRLRRLVAEAYGRDEAAWSELLGGYRERELERLLEFQAKRRELDETRLRRLEAKAERRLRRSAGPARPARDPRSR